MAPVAAFDFGTADRLIFGPGRATELGTLIDGWGSRALICTGSRRVVPTPGLSSMRAAISVGAFADRD